MQKYLELASALEYIEKHMQGNCTQADIAKAACVSLSALQKMFRFTFGYSVNEYILKRKMTAAAEELENSPLPISELAIKYGYCSTEAFSRAFLKVNCVLPSEYRKGKKVQAVFTPLQVDETGIRRESPLLIEEIYNAWECYVVCFDVAGMKKIDKISREAGNFALLETVQRIHVHITRHIAQKVRIFRIGRDEYALITPFLQSSEAENFVSKVLEHNGDCFSYKGQSIPLYLRGWYGKNILTEEIPNPAEALRQKVKYQGFMEVKNERNLTLRIS